MSEVGCSVMPEITAKLLFPSRWFYYGAFSNNSKHEGSGLRSTLELTSFITDLHYRY